MMGPVPPGSDPGPEERIAELQKEIADLNRLIEESRASAKGQAPSVLEAGFLVALGVLGIVGSGYLTGGTLAATLPKEIVQGHDFSLGLLSSLQEGLRKSLGESGTRLAVVAGWLILLALLILPWVDRARPKAKPLRTVSSWPLGTFAFALISLPYYNFSTGRAPIGTFAGVAVASALFSFVLVFQKSDTVRAGLKFLQDLQVVAGLASVAVLLFLWGVLWPYPPALLAAALMAACFSFGVLSVGLRHSTGANEVAQLQEKLNELRDKLWRETRDERAWRKLLAKVQP